MADPRQTSRVPLLSFLISTAGCVVTYAAWKAIRAYDLPVGQYGKLGVSLIVFFFVGAGIGRLVRREKSPHGSRLAAVGLGAALIGIAAGFVFWNALEDYVLNHVGAYPIDQERHFYLAEVAKLWTYAFLPMLAGVFAGVITSSEQRSS